MTQDPEKKRAQRVREHERRREHRAKNDEWAQKQRTKQRLRHVPKGMMLERVSKLVDANGDTSKEWQKSKLAPDEPPKFALEPPGFTQVSQSSMVTPAGVSVQWVRHEKDKAEQYAQMIQAMRDATAEYRGIAEPVLIPEFTDRKLLNLIPIGDPHIGMLSWSKETSQAFDSEIARVDLLKCMRLIFDRSPKAKTCLIAQLGDFFHAEDDKQVTPTAGHKLDVDTRAGRITKLGFMLMRATIDMALVQHDHVIVCNLRGNHDPYKSIALNLWLQAVYEREPRVTVLDNNDPYIFHEHGLNLLGFHHGDGAKPSQLPGIMATYKEGAPWGRTRHRKWFTGHVHSENGSDFAGCSWQSCRTLAPADYWAWHKGYRSEQSIECHTYHEDEGLVSRQPVTLRLARSTP